VTLMAFDELALEGESTLRLPYSEYFRRCP
jgi:hypothetical protein